MTNMTWITTPGHGFLQVTQEEYNFNKGDFIASPYSYQNKDYIYLEEDCDAPGFLKAMYPEELGLSRKILQWVNVIHNIPERYDENEVFKTTCW